MVHTHASYTVMTIGWASGDFWTRAPKCLVGRLQLEMNLDTRPVGELVGIYDSCLQLVGICPKHVVERAPGPMKR